MHQYRQVSVLRCDGGRSRPLLHVTLALNFEFVSEISSLRHGRRRHIYLSLSEHLICELRNRRLRGMKMSVPRGGAASIQAVSIRYGVPF